jgi:hypothetical protein
MAVASAVLSSDLTLQDITSQMKRRLPERASKGRTRVKVKNMVIDEALMAKIILMPFVFGRNRSRYHDATDMGHFDEQVARRILVDAQKRNTLVQVWSRLSPQVSANVLQKDPFLLDQVYSGVLRRLQKWLDQQPSYVTEGRLREEIAALLTEEVGGDVTLVTEMAIQALTERARSVLGPDRWLTLESPAVRVLLDLPQVPEPLLVSQGPEYLRKAQIHWQKRLPTGLAEEDPGAAIDAHWKGRVVTQSVLSLVQDLYREEIEQHTKRIRDKKKRQVSKARN